MDEWVGSGRDKLQKRATSFGVDRSQAALLLEAFDLVKEIGQTCDRSATVRPARRTLDRRMVTAAELRMAAMLRVRAISGWQMHRKDIPVTPDFYFPGLQLALFIGGSFWHQCPRYSKLPMQKGTF